MNNLKEIVANNIIILRKERKLTQLEFASELHYSDKTISKWERAESIPDIIVLKQVADFFGVTVDYLLNEHFENEDLPIAVENNSKKKYSKINKLSLTLLSSSPVWLIATIIFTAIAVFSNMYVWFIYFICVPITMLLFLIFNSIWGNKKRNYFIISCFIWSILLCVYFSFIKYNAWQIFILGIPSQIIIFLWSKLKNK